MSHKVVFEDAGVREWLGRVAGKTPLMAPVRRGRVSHDFAWVTDPGQVSLDYVRTVMPPKQALWPTRQPLVEFGEEGGGRVDFAPQAKPVAEGEPFVLFGVHPCDLTGIGLLDWAMAQRDPYPDPSWVARRAAATIVTLDCLPDEYCFCTLVGSSDTREGADVALTPLAEGFLGEALTPKGDELLRLARGTRKPSEAEAAEAARWPEEKARRTRVKLGAEVGELADLLGARYESEVFEATARRCYSCGTCTNVCPTCFCFDVWDELELTLAGGMRSRRYDSCQSLNFALVAGPHNFRGERSDRVRHRWFRKFVYLLREHGRPFCVGCGRCSQACTAGISLVDVMNAVLSEAKEAAAR